MIYTYVDNFLPEDFCDELYKTFTSDDFPWCYYDSITKSDEDKTKQFYFVHTFFLNDKIKIFLTRKNFLTGKLVFNSNTLNISAE